jgi:protein phosphatase methylesterase 1
MGGAIAARAAASGKILNLVAVAVLDVVEGTAMAALPHMHNILENRPQNFDSLESAIQWRFVVHDCHS